MGERTDNATTRARCAVEVRAPSRSARRSSRCSPWDSSVPEQPLLDGPRRRVRHPQQRAGRVRPLRDEPQGRVRGRRLPARPVAGRLGDQRRPRRGGGLRQVPVGQVIESRARKAMSGKAVTSRRAGRPTRTRSMKVAVFGRPGGGKSTFALQIAHDRDLPFAPSRLTSVRRRAPGCRMTCSLPALRGPDRAGWVIDGFGTRQSFEDLLAAAVLVYVERPAITHYWWITKRFLVSPFSIRSDGPTEAPSSSPRSIATGFSGSRTDSGHLRSERDCWHCAPRNASI